MLAEREGAQGKRTDLVTACYEVNGVPILKDLEITKMQSSRWQEQALGRGHSHLLRWWRLRARPVRPQRIGLRLKSLGDAG